MAATHTFLGQTKLAGTAATMTLSVISGDYQDLEIVVLAKHDSNVAAYGRVSFNGDSGTSHYGRCNLYLPNGTTAAGTVSETGEGYIDVSYGTGPSSGFGAVGWCRMYIPAYSASEPHPIDLKHCSWDTTTAGENAWQSCMYQPGTPAAITSVTWTASAVMEIGCSITAYGIKYE